MIPIFPRFKPIELADKEELSCHQTTHPPLTSEYTFTNLFAWRAAGNYHLARFHDGYLIRKGTEGAYAFLQPLVAEKKADAVRECLAYLQECSRQPAIERVDESFLQEIPADGCTFLEDRDQFDYLYSVQELIELPGERFHDKKNLLAQCRKKYRYLYRPLDTAAVLECLSFAHDWCVERNCEKNESLSRENCAVTQMLAHYNDLDIMGGALEIDGELSAFTLAERLDRDTIVIHVEKARAGIVGAYQAINREFLFHAANDYTYVNREQDLGVEGLRKAKLSYNPVRLLKKFRIVPA